jgi:polyhydroxybutyrate depolymerase
MLKGVLDVRGAGQGLRRRVRLPVSWLVVAGVLLSVSVPSVWPADHEIVIQTEDGRSRFALVYTPRGVAGGEPVPLVMVLHGGGGNAAGTRASTGMDRVADENGFLVVYPEGTGQQALGRTFATWNAGSCCGDAVEDQVDDVAFIDHLLDRLAQRYPIDERRIYVTGISNGAAMSQRLACDLADRIAAIAPIAGPGVPPECGPSRPVPVLFIHGTDDRCALYEGGERCGGCWQQALETAFGVPDRGEGRFACEGVEQQVDFWRSVNGCGTGSSPGYRHGAATCRESSGCPSAPVEMCTIEGGGHTWPGTRYTCDPESELCRAFMEVSGEISQDLDANRYMWRFFSRHSASEPPRTRPAGPRVRSGRDS